MDSLVTLPRRSWLERTLLVLAGLSAAVGIAAFWDSWLQLGSVLPALHEELPVRRDESLALAVFGLALIARELGWRPALWATVLSFLIGARGLFVAFSNRDLGSSGLVDLMSGGPGAASAPHLSAMTAGCLVLGSSALFWNAFQHAPRSRLFTTAFTGSLIASVGFSTLFGYRVNLHAIYKWGSDTAMPQLTAIGLLLLGIILLLTAWRENLRDESGPPAWSPLPAIIACLTLTLVLWLGLRDSERTFLGGRTLTARDQIATAILFELQAQTNSLERLARRWGDGPGNATVWEADTASQFSESKPFGCVVLSYVDDRGVTRWVFPTARNEVLLGFDHHSDPVRDDAVRLALKNALKNSNPALSGTTTINADGHLHRKGGFVIYAPVLRPNQPTALIAAEFLYSKFFQKITAGKHTGAADDYHFTITIGQERVFESVEVGEESSDEIESLDKTFNFSGQRIRIAAAPTAAFVRENRRYFPEIALVTGLSFTALLGLSIHFARRARTGQTAAETSNKKLMAEISERARIEGRLKISDERLRLALDSTQIGIFEWQVLAGQVYYSPGLWALLGYEHSHMPATVQTWQALIHPEDLPLYRRRTETQLAGVATFIDPEYRVRAHPGDWRWIQMRSKSVASAADGRPTRIIGTVQDITARREAEQALRESQAEARKLSLVASKTDNPVIIGTPDGRIEWVNDAFCRVMEYSLHDVFGKNPAHFMIGAETAPRTVVRLRAAMARGLGISTDVVNYSKSGRKYHIHLEIQPIKNSAGAVETFIAILTDITARVESETALRRAKSEADSASRAKSEFLASMSHEIRTPMNGVIGMTSLLMETSLTHEQRDYVNTVRTSGEALLTIINDILDFSKIESGKMELERMPFELSLCIEEALDLFALQASAKKIEIGYHLAPNVPAWIVGDVTRLRQVLVNLFNNAVKFTPSGSIFIEVRRVGPDPLDLFDITPFRLEFAVRDTGIGIPPNRLDRLFKAFSQVDSSTTRKFGGTGLGLVICQRLSQLMGGDIRVESTPGAGSAFIFTITIETAALTPGAKPSLPPLPSRLLASPVLIVEAHPLAQAHLRSCFEQWGATCLIASDTAAAARLLATLPAPPALLLVGGGETGGPSSPDLLATLVCPRLVMFPFGQTAPTPPAGFFAPFTALPKPIKQTALHHSVLALFDTGGATASPFAKTTERPLADEFPLRVLLAEDNPVNQKVATRSLERLGYRADAVVNGLEAVAALEQRRYDLILMDLQMPEMDGLEASRRIRRLPLEAQPKIIALTAHAMQGDRELCLAAGMDDYVTKPVKIHEIAAAIRRQFGAPVSAPQTIG
ncbi:MAG: response regulator [Undibacterium sp.]|nr:response regulator [Opitutaceae bacterium]